MKLTELLQENREIMDALYASDGELTPELEMALANINVSLPEKVDGYCAIMDRIANEAIYLDEKATAFKAAAKSLDTAYARIKDRIQGIMENNGLEKLSGNDYVFSLKRTKGKVIVTNQELVPKEYIKTEVTETVDKMKIYSEIKAGADVPGAHVEENKTLQRQINKTKG